MIDGLTYTELAYLRGDGDRPLNHYEELTHQVYLTCPCCRDSSRKVTPDITEVTQIETDEVWASLLCPACLTVTILVITFHGDEEK